MDHNFGNVSQFITPNIIKQESDVLQNMERVMSHKSYIANEKKLRREIANSNERRRMQSINAGFESLKICIPHQVGEKMSKAAILQAAADYIHSLEKQNGSVCKENIQLKEMLTNMGLTNLPATPKTDGAMQDSPPPKRKKRDTESSDEGIALRDADFVDDGLDDHRVLELLELRSRLEKEQKLRLTMEQQIVTLKQQFRQQISQLQQPRFVTTVKDNNIAPNHNNVMTKQGVAPPTNAIVNETPAPQTEEASTSKRNLMTILEAIMHLEGGSLPLDNDERSSDSPMLLNSDSDTDTDMETAPAPVSVAPAVQWFPNEHRIARPQRVESEAQTTISQHIV